DAEAEKANAVLCARHVAEGRLRLHSEHLTRENIASLFARFDVPVEFDVLSLDIDRNTSFLWRGLADYRPRVVVVEYNAAIPAMVDWEVEYDASAVWDKSVYFGASLNRLERVGASMGYDLVGCTLSGVNAFFVRNDLTGDKFARPFTAEHHYEPSRHYLIRTPVHERGFGDSGQPS
ncbi:MAG: hypothetical protein JWM95_495, partial [Gemmatimonadetes bacterium]|nr:hypothetical protein [Gemmatimonadota bacterium]